MTSINTSSLSAYSSTFTVAIKKDDSATTTQADSSATDTSAAATTATTEAGSAGGAGGAGGSGSSSSTSEQAIEKLEQQIEEAEKRLQEQQEQLAAAQSSHISDDEKNQRVMAIQSQIASTSASIATQQAALLQLEQSGSINTTA